MGTWDVGPFVRGALTRVIDTVDYLEAPESEVAVAAAALVAAQCPVLLPQPPGEQLSLI